MRDSRGKRARGAVSRDRLSMLSMVRFPKGLVAATRQTSDLKRGLRDDRCAARRAHYDSRSLYLRHHRRGDCELAGRLWGDQHLQSIRAHGPACPSFAHGAAVRADTANHSPARGARSFATDWSLAHILPPALAHSWDAVVMNAAKAAAGRLRFCVKLTPKAGRDAIDGWATDA